MGRVELLRDKDREAWLPKRVGFSIGGTQDGFVFRRSDETVEVPDPEDGLTENERRTLDAICNDFDEKGATASEWLRAAKMRKVSVSSFWRAKRAITPPRKEGLVIVDSDGRFRAVSSSEPPDRDRRGSGTDMPDSDKLSELSNDYHDSSDSSSATTTITPLYKGDSSRSAADSAKATQRADVGKGRALLEDPPP